MSTKKFYSPLQSPYTPLTTIKQLQEAAQLAIQVEWTTIPAYLTALYSIQDVTSNAYQTLRSVVVEEMFHINQAANILVGIGGKPNFTDPKVVPTYPAYLPSASQKNTPYIGLYRASQEVFREIFMGIETPAPYNAPPQAKGYETIAQLYKTLELGLEAAVEAYGPDKVFKQDKDACQRTDIYLGKFGGKAIEIVNLASAKTAIEQIVQQGEGAIQPGHTLAPLQPWGTKNHYGMRLDGTYGPILGTPLEMSHYFKFQVVANASSFPATYPIISNPEISDFVNPKARVKAFLFNAVYTIMLMALEDAFSSKYNSDWYFKVVMPLMHHAMPTLARSLMTTTLMNKGSADVGPNAAPTFEFIPGLDWEIAFEALDAYIEGRPFSNVFKHELIDAVNERIEWEEDDIKVAKTVKKEMDTLYDTVRAVRAVRAGN